MSSSLLLLLLSLSSLLLLFGVVIVVGSCSCGGGKVCSSVRVFVSSVAVSVSVCRVSTGTVSMGVDSSTDTFSSSGGVCCVIVSSEIIWVVDSSGVMGGGSVLIGFFVLGFWLYPAIMKIMPRIVERDIQNILVNSVNMNNDAMANIK